MSLLTNELSEEAKQLRDKIQGVVNCTHLDIILRDKLFVKLLGKLFYKAIPLKDFLEILRGKLYMTT